MGKYYLITSKMAVEVFFWVALFNVIPILIIPTCIRNCQPNWYMYLKKKGKKRNESQ